MGKITVAAYGEDEQLWAFCQAFRDYAKLPVDGFVIGEPVSIVQVRYDGNARRGLTAVCRKADGDEYLVVLMDVALPQGTEAERYLAAYRKWAGLNPVSLSLLPRKKHRALDEDIDISGSLDLIVLNVKDQAARCRIPGTERIVTLRSGDVWNAAPGEVLRIRPRKYWLFSGHPFLSGEIETRRIDIPVLGLTPLGIEGFGLWDPAGESWGDEEKPPPEWAKPIIQRGPRPLFEMEQVMPGTDPEDPFDDPILRASDLWEAGALEEANTVLMDMAEADLRCLDVHSHLGNMVFELRPRDALRHYEIGMRIGELSLGEVFDGVLLWGFIDNRPFLRCVCGYGLSLWRLDRPDEARAVFERMLLLNPKDNQGARFMRADVQAGKTWEQHREEWE